MPDNHHTRGNMPKAKAYDTAMSHAEVRARFHYDPGTGIVTDKATGTTAGTPTAEGYLTIRILGRNVLLHRLAYFYMYGVWPKDQIDHVNGKRDDNRLINIRPATARQNSLNRGVSTKNNSGYKGVYWCAKSQRWRAAITIDGRKHQIRGKFITAFQAHQAYVAAAREHHKEFARWEKNRPSQPVRPEPVPLVAGSKIKPVRDWLSL